MRYYEIEEAMEKLKIMNYRGIFMRDQLNDLKPLENECGILNLNSSKDLGSHWTAWYKKKDDIYYFCSYGSSPPIELEKYFKVNQNDIKRHKFCIQDLFDEHCCGEMAIQFLILMDRDWEYKEAVLFLVR